MRSKLIPQLLAAVLFTAVATPALAQPYGPPRPRAGHAITDLRAARNFLTQNPRGVNPTDSQVVALIDKVIAASQRVVYYDKIRMHADVEWTPDNTASTPSHHENARLMMTAALRDLDQPEPDPSARPYLDQARQQLREALALVQQEEAAHKH